MGLLGLNMVDQKLLLIWLIIVMSVCCGIYQRRVSALAKNRFVTK